MGQSNMKAQALFMKERAIDMGLHDCRTTGVIHEASSLRSGHSFAGSCASNAGDWQDEH